MIQVVKHKQIFIPLAHTHEWDWNSHQLRNDLFWRFDWMFNPPFFPHTNFIWRELISMIIASRFYIDTIENLLHCIALHCSNRYNEMECNEMPLFVVATCLILKHECVYPFCCQFLNKMPNRTKSKLETILKR